MSVVADSSAFIVLVPIGLVEILPALFGRLVIPPEVESEVADPKRPPTVRAFIAARPPWLEVRSPASVERIEGLHPGETAAIALASELRADRVILDDADGRTAATQRGLNVIGTIGVLEAAAQRGLLDLGQAFAAVKQTDFWVSHAWLGERLALFLTRGQARALPEEQGRG